MNIDTMLHAVDSIAMPLILCAIGVCGYFLRENNKRLEHIELKVDGLTEAGAGFIQWRTDHTKEDDSRFHDVRSHTTRVEARLDAHIGRSAPGL